MAILAAVDVEGVPEQVVGTGHELATAFDDELVVLGVMTESEHQSRMHGRADSTVPDDYEHTLSDSRNEIERGVEDVVHAAVGVDESVRVEGRIGDPAEEIVALAEQIDAQYVVVGGRERSEVEAAVFGSVSREVMRETDRPVVSLMKA